MELVLLIIVVVGVVAFVVKTTKVTPEHSAQLVIEKKQCPPHQWYWQEIVDQHGVKHGERIVCKVCGPLASHSGREE